MDILKERIFLTGKTKRVYIYFRGSPSLRGMHIQDVALGPFIELEVVERHDRPRFEVIAHRRWNLDLLSLFFGYMGVEMFS